MYVAPQDVEFCRAAIFGFVPILVAVAFQDAVNAGFPRAELALVGFDNAGVMLNNRGFFALDGACYRLADGFSQNQLPEGVCEIKNVTFSVFAIVACKMPLVLAGNR